MRSMMSHPVRFPVRGLLMALALVCASVGGQAQTGATTGAQAGELPIPQLTVLRQKLAQRLPDLPPVDGARTAPISGLIEVRAGGHIFYTDANGDYLIEGQMLDTRSQRNLTEERLDEINKVEFDSLPFKDALVWKSGNGKRRMAIFADPNCGYCKRLEKELNQIKDVTVYTFMIPILSEDSKVKLDAIWCLKDRTQAWRDWMLTGVAPAKTFGACTSPGQRNLALAGKLRVTGTPAMFFENGSRIASAVPGSVIEQRLTKAAQAKSGG